MKHMTGLMLVALVLLAALAGQLEGMTRGTAESAWTADILLTDEGATWTGDGAVLEGNTLKLKGSGSYRLSGSWPSGQIVVDAGKKGYVTLVLDGLSVTSETGSALMVSSAKRVTLLLAEGSENRLTSSGTDEGTAASTLYTKADITIEGQGSLALASAGKHGLQASDSLTLSGGALTVGAAQTGVRANDFIAIAGGSLTITSGGDGVQSRGSESKPDTGWLTISGGMLAITSGEDGLQASDDLAILGGEVTVDAMDDALHSDGSIRVTGGTLTLQSGDDGVHAEEELVIEAGRLTVLNSYEGLEAFSIELNGGEVEINAMDDGVNAGGGQDGAGLIPGGGGMREGLEPGPWTRDGGQTESGEDGEMSEQAGPVPPEDGEGPERDGLMPPEDGQGPMKGREQPDGESTRAGEEMQAAAQNGSDAALPSLVIRGGTITVNAEGDGLDSNGDLRIEGGAIIVNGPTDSMNGALDSGTESGGTLTITGGTILALGASGMDETFNGSSSQVSLRCSGYAYEVGSVIRVTDSEGAVLTEYTAKKPGSSVVFSSPALAQGETVTLEAGAQSVEITLDEMSVSVGERGGRGPMRDWNR